MKRTVRAVAYQVLGAALLTPAAIGLGLLILGLPTPAGITPPRVLVLWAACLPAAAVLATTPLVRRLEVVALAELLDLDVPPRADRLYVAVLTTLHLYGGATLSAGVLALSPAFLHWRRASDDRPEVVLLVVALLGAMVAASVGQRWAARRLLRSEPSRVIDELSRRQTLALELHDSVGHALSVVLVQAMAAQAALQRSEPGIDLADRSLDHLTATARHAQQDLDVLVGVLDDDTTADGPTLAALATLTGGLDVRATVGPLDRVPAATSRAAFALAREALTNALRHGRGPVTLDVAVGTDVVLTVGNAVNGESRDAGRGLTGMRMRARLVGGTCVWERSGGMWRVEARLPL